MAAKKNYLKRGALVIAALVFTYFAFTSRINYMQHGRHSPGQEDSIFYSKAVLKAIPCADSPAGLLGFEVHKKHTKTGTSVHTEYNVVMRSLDPKVDTYKAYCRDIIADVAGEAGSNADFTINVFDSFEAYCFYADTYPLWDREGMLAHHLVATYERGRDDEGRHSSLTFYPYAGNYLTESRNWN